jgi:hypothetical protein
VAKVSHAPFETGVAYLDDPQEAQTAGAGNADNGSPPGVGTTLSPEALAARVDTRKYTVGGSGGLWGGAVMLVWLVGLQAICPI